LQKKNININCINPGFTKTSYFENFKKKSLYKWTLKKISMNRWADSKEISKLIIFLSSDDASYINGETINIDGSWS
jgi:3-oxoacyl-[acyl-carrier protein] reductase